MRKIIKAAVAASGAVALAVLAAVPASAGLGGSLYASCKFNDGNACAGEVVTGNTGQTFRFVTATAFTRNPDAYQAITDGLGWQVGLKRPGGFDAIVGISDSSPANGAGYSPQSLVYHPGSAGNTPGTLVAVAPNAVWCPAPGSTCAPASQGGAFPVGTNVTLSVFYNKAQGTVNFDAFDPAGDLYKAFYHVGVISFTQPRIEAGYDPGNFSPPTVITSFVRPASIGFTTTTGAGLNLRSASVTRHREFGTSTGFSTGTVQAGPGAVNSAGTSFPVDFLP
jgi:hypothetical protein